MVGQFLDLKLTPRLFYRNSIEIFRFSTVDWELTLLDVSGSLEWYPFKNVGFGIGYNLVDIDYTDDDGSERLQAEYRFDGILFYVSLAY